MKRRNVNVDGCELSVLSLYFNQLSNNLSPRYLKYVYEQCKFEILIFGDFNAHP